MKKILFSLMITSLFLGSCKTTRKGQANAKSGLNKTEKGAIIGATSGAVIGAIISNKSKNTALGAILGATVGGAVGVVIGNKMDKQAKKLEDQLGETAKVERVGEGIKLTFNSQLLFDFGKTDLNETNKANLQKFAETLKQYPDTDLLIVGHTDNVGSVVFNQTLSQNRASTVSNQLSYYGINDNRLKSEGKGENDPIVSNESEDNRSQNRRVEIAIYANEKMKSESKMEVKQ